MLSSLPLQIVLFFNTIYAFLWTAAMLVLFAWKGARARMPPEPPTATYGKHPAATALQPCLCVTMRRPDAGTHLPYDGKLRSLLGLEVALVFALLICELARLFIASRGNKLEQARPEMQRAQRPAA